MVGLTIQEMLDYICDHDSSGNITENNSPMASSSSTAFYYKQTARESVTGYHQTSPHSQGIVIEMEPSNRADNQPPTLSTVDYSIISKLVIEKSFDELNRLGGVDRLTTSLQTNLQCGIRGGAEEISRRANAFGTNSYGKPPTESVLSIAMELFQDPTILILLLCAGLLLGLGIKKKGPSDGWYDGGSIFLAVFLVNFVTAIREFWLSKKLDQLSNTSNNVAVDTVRDSKRQRISTYEIVVGDVVLLKMGDQVPADGLFIDGASLRVDESRLTGESDPVEVNQDQNPFLLSGSMVVDGYATMLITCVGKSTFWGEMMNSISSELNMQTPLEVRLHDLAVLTGFVGLAVASTILPVLCIRYFTGHTRDEYGRIQYIPGKTKVYDAIEAMVGIIAGVVSVVVIGIPEVLPLAGRLTLAYSTEKMQVDQAQVRDLSACEIMGSTTAICVDMTTTLLSNRMTVTNSFIGKESIEGRSYTCIAANVLQLFVQGIGVTTNIAHKLFTVTQMDDAIRVWVLMKLNVEMDTITEGLSVVRVEASCAEQKRMGVLVKRQSESIIHVHWRGDFERILSSCSHYYDITGATIVLDDREKEGFNQMMENMADTGLRWIAFAHKHLLEEECGNGIANDKNLIFLGVIGLKGFCRQGTKHAIETCQQAGIKVKMITSQSVSEAEAVAIECGILSPVQEENEGTVVTGEEFRRYQEKVQLEKVEKIRVVARSSPADKLLMVRCLKEKGEVVALTGAGITCASALKEADVGILMATQGTEEEKQNSDIIILDDRFASVATAVRQGRSVYDNIQKIIQFQLTMIVAAFAINLVAAFWIGETILTPGQLLWANLIMETIGAVALASEKPSDRLMRRPPVSRYAPLITNIMWRNIICQASFQIAVILALKFKGRSIIRVDENVVDKLVFTIFVLVQVFNQFNSRAPEEMNVFRGILENKLFLGSIGVAIILLVITVESLSKLVHTERLDWKQWGGSIGIAAFSLPLGWLAKFLPVPARPFLNHIII